MKSEKEKMISGELYSPLDAVLTEERQKARLLLKKLNDSLESDVHTGTAILKQLLPNAGDGLWIQPPFYCDYGYNINTGRNVFLNFNCVILDVAPVSIGSRVMMGPNVQIYAAGHPLDHKERASGLEFGKPVIIGDDVWIGGSAIICPDVFIGKRCVIGAGSVVTKDIPAGVFAAGNPCKVIREL
ncbi:MAG: sugar O-acetyltransferase [Ginsengibacter sp.]